MKQNRRSIFNERRRPLDAPPIKRASPLLDSMLALAPGESAPSDHMSRTSIYHAVTRLRKKGRMPEGARFSVAQPDPLGEGTIRIYRVS